MNRDLRILALVSNCLLAVTVFAKGPAYTDPAKAAADFVYQGEYAGEAKAGDAVHRVASQVVAQGNGKFHATVYDGGLPGEGGNVRDRRVIPGGLKNGIVAFDDEQFQAELKGEE